MDEQLSVFQSGGGGKIKIRDGDFLPMMRYVRREGMMSGNRHKCILRSGLVVERTFFQLYISKNRCQRILGIHSVAPQAASDSATVRTAGTASPLDFRRTLNHSLPGLNRNAERGRHHRSRPASIREQHVRFRFLTAAFAIDHAAIVIPSQMTPDRICVSIPADVTRRISNSSVSSGVPPMYCRSLAIYTWHISLVTPL